MPLPAVWGPKLWMILHGLGGRCGRSAPQVRRDELRELKWLISHLETIVPCPECRKHIVEYRITHSLPEICQDYGKWLWEFHSAVNIRLGKQSIPFTQEIGSTTNLTTAWDDFFGCLKESILKGAVSAQALRTFKQHLRLWQGFAGI